MMGMDAGSLSPVEVTVWCCCVRACWGKCRGSHIWMGLLSMLSSCVSVVGVNVDKGEDEAGGSTGTGTGGILPSRSCRSVRMACTLPGGAYWMPVIASVRRCMAAMILSVDGMVGMGIAWCLKRKVLVSRSLSVPFIIVCMHRWVCVVAM
jgi:hypothetical protein